MTTLSYPFTLVAGQPENVNQLNSNLNAVTTWANGNVDTTNLATSAKPATLRAPYQTISEATFGVLTSTLVTGSGVYLPTLSSTLASGANASNVNPWVLITLDPTAYAVTGLTAKLRVVAATATNTVAATNNFTYGLYPVTVAGSAGNVAVTAGTVVSGSTVTRSAPSTSTLYQDASADFTAPSAGVYALGFAASAGMAASSAIVQTLRLEYHHI